MRRECGSKPLSFWLYFGLITGLGRSDVQMASEIEFAPDCLLRRGVLCELTFGDFEEVLAALVGRG